MEHSTDRAMAAFTWPRLGTPVLRVGAAMALLQAPWLPAIASEKVNKHRYCKRRVGCERRKEGSTRAGCKRINGNSSEHCTARQRQLRWQSRLKLERECERESWDCCWNVRMGMG
ncbi:hypothetical protein M758_8G101200 [Ceratodon purpureus]|nr:hypothetical protein M758_8G101200 [Ceratodon purpureus]